MIGLVSMSKRGTTLEIIFPSIGIGVYPLSTLSFLSLIFIFKRTITSKVHATIFIDHQNKLKN